MRICVQIANVLADQMHLKLVFADRNLSVLHQCILYKGLYCPWAETAHTRR